MLLPIDVMAVATAAAWSLFPSGLYILYDVLCVFSSSSLYTHIFFFIYYSRAVSYSVFLIRRCIRGRRIMWMCYTYPCHSTHYRRGETNGSIFKFFPFSSFACSFGDSTIQSKCAKDGLQQQRRKMLAFFSLFFFRRLQAVVWTYCVIRMRIKSHQSNVITFRSVLLDSPMCVCVWVRESFSFRLLIMANKVFEWRMKKETNKSEMAYHHYMCSSGCAWRRDPLQIPSFALSRSSPLSLSLSCSLDRSLRFLHILLFNKNDSIVCIWRSFGRLCNVGERVCVAAWSQRNLVNKRNPLYRYLSLSLCFDICVAPFVYICTLARTNCCVHCAAWIRLN